MKKAAICFALICICKLVYSYSCANRTINVNGVTDKLAKSFYLVMTSAYSTFRQRFNYDSSVNILANSSLITPLSYVSYGIIGPVTDPPIVFANTPFYTPLHNNEMQFPIAAQGIVAIYNLPGITNLNLTVQTIAAIFKGAIAYWNHPTIVKQNPNAKLPNEEILPIARNDNDATTIFFTTILTTVDQDWNRTGTFKGPMFVNDTCCNSTKWPNNAISYYGNDIVGIVGLVYSISYSIGYAASSSVSQYAVSVVNLLSNENDILSISLPNVENMGKSMYNFMNSSNPSDVYVKVDNSIMNGAYPLTIYLYFLVNFTYDSSIDCCVIQELVGFLDWLFSSDTESMIISNGYVPIIDSLENRIKQVILSRAQCKEGYVYPKYLASMVSSDDNSSWQVILITIVALVAVSTMLTTGLYVYFRKFYVDQRRWLIDADKVKVVQVKMGSIHGSGVKLEDSASLTPSSLSNSQRRSNTINSGSQQQGAVRDMKELMNRGEMDENKVHLDALACKPPQQWTSTTKRSINKLKNVAHKNCMALLGFTNINGQPNALFEFCQKGTLHYVLQTSRYNLTSEIKHQFASDIAEGLKYLHQNGIIHAYLNSITCYLDGSWTVKIAQWEKTTIYQQENFYQLISHGSYKHGADLDESRLIELLYIDPRMATTIDENLDIFSFGFLLIEIFTRKLPYSTTVDEGEDSYSDLLGKKFGVHYVVQPKESKGLKSVHDLAIRCIGPVEARPSVAKICQTLKSAMKSTTGIVDIIMDTLEKHADALEEKVEERTSELKHVQLNTIQRQFLNNTNEGKIFNICCDGVVYLNIGDTTKITVMVQSIFLTSCCLFLSTKMLYVELLSFLIGMDCGKLRWIVLYLKKVTEKMRHLLHEVLPAQIADNLLSGLPVLPEQFECITVYFSDIVGFTTISAQSSPIEVMTLLNDLWLVFDKIIERFDVYKVDTIGDAYMVCSGLPNRNGMEHCRQIALLSLALLEKCNRFKITHLPDEQLKIRIGINSGPATAGVVGSKMPQYCVFGDTVNTAARMESTSIPQKIQLSERTNVLLQDHFPNSFEIVYRGEIDVKGKGAMRTYWLERKV